MIKANNEGERVTTDPIIHSSNFPKTADFYFIPQKAWALKNLHKGFQEFQREGCGWTQDVIVHFEVNVTPFKSLSGCSYISLPDKILAKNDNAYRLSHYVQSEQELITSMLVFPTPLSRIPAFDKAS